MLDAVLWILICYLYLCIFLCFILKSAWEPCLPDCWPLLTALFSFRDSQHAFSSDAILIYRFCSVLKLVFAGYSYSFQRSWAYGACVISVLCVLWALSSLSFIGLFLYIDLQLPVSYIGPHLCMPHKFWLHGRKRILCCLFIGCVSLICCQSWLWPGLNWLSVLSRCACQLAGPEKPQSRGNFPVRWGCRTLVRVFWWLHWVWQSSSLVAEVTCESWELFSFILLTTLAHCWVFFFHVFVRDQTQEAYLYRSEVVSVNFPLVLD